MKKGCGDKKRPDSVSLRENDDLIHCACGPNVANCNSHLFLGGNKYTRVHLMNIEVLAQLSNNILYSHRCSAIFNFLPQQIPSTNSYGRPRETRHSKRSFVLILALLCTEKE